MTDPHRFKTTKADGRVYHHELQFVSHIQREDGDTTEDTWGILPTVTIDKSRPEGLYLRAEQE